MSVVLREGTIAGFIEDAWREMTALGDELQSWLDSMPETQQESDRGLELAEAIEAIESGPYEPEVPSIIRDESLDCDVVIYAQMSRATRRDNCVKMLDAIIEKCAELSETQGGAPEIDAFSSNLTVVREEWTGLVFPRRD